MKLVENKILFISHDASRTGAPILLKYHLQWLKKVYPNQPFDVFLLKGGEIADEFESIGNIVSLPVRTVFSKILSRLFKSYDDFDQRLKILLKNRYKILYGNTIVTSDIIRRAKIINPEIVTICHVHELEIAIKQFFHPELFRKAISYIDYFIAASLAVKKVLVDEYLIQPDKVCLLYEDIPMVERQSISKKTGDTVFNDGLKICGCGTLDWRKGIDLFILAVSLLERSVPDGNFHFYWIGGNKLSLDYAKVMYDIARLNVGHRMTIVENCSNPLDYIDRCDVFLLTSREDPFPIVCLEAASLGKPLICFKQSGGMPEMVDETNGWLIDYLNLDELNNLFVSMLENSEIKELMSHKGEAARIKAQQFDIKDGIVKLKSFLDSILSEN